MASLSATLGFASGANAPFKTSLLVLVLCISLCAWGTSQSPQLAKEALAEEQSEETVRFQRMEQIAQEAVERENDPVALILAQVLGGDFRSYLLEIVDSWYDDNGEWYDDTGEWYDNGRSQRN